MKVLHVIPSLSIVHGGPTHALAAMERALTGEGAQVETATTDDDGPHQHNGKQCGEPLPENGVVRRYFRKSSDFYKVSTTFARWINREIRNYDLVHVHALFSFTSMVASRAARRAGVPYVIRPLGTLNGYGMTQRRPWLKRLSMELVEGPALRGAAAVHFTSVQEAQEARRLGLALRDAVIPLGINVAAFDLSASHRGVCDPESPSVLFLSRLDPKKNLEGLLDAVALVRQDMPGLRLVVAGSGPPDYVAALRRRASERGIGPQVTWTGHLEGAMKAAAFAAADVFVLPSYSENFGIAAAEALAAGLPCLVGEGVAIADDVVQAGAGLATATDAQAIADGLRRIIAQSRCAPMSLNARTLARDRFSDTAMGARLNRLYVDILADRLPERTQ
ncbi:glycosyltransferase [Ramlibacter sp. WS9]|uniref:glycosyltransferase n=1 Tax=Ramlibacter sp. WS9 TaxID=1882741 RepID=UPI00114249D5|nr:glycosyltransferase [Ramlibacter sp. WS9]ROZ66353.1 glycosyltransferase [Ramlibacter sp. WS9]